MENEITDKKIMKLLKTKDFLNEPLFDVIDVFFGTFTLLHLGLMELVWKHNKPKENIPDELEEPNLFIVDIDTIKKRITIELCNNPNSQVFIQRYITDKYDTIKSDLAKWDNEFHGYKSLFFPIKKNYVDNGTFAKSLFFCSVEFWGTKDNPKEQPTIGDFYNKIMKELETGYNAIMAIFENTEQKIPTSQPDTKQPQQSKYFTRSFSETEQKKLFDGLINDGFLPKETNYSHFCYVFGGTTIPDNETPFEPLLWLKDTQDLKIFIDTFFPNEKSKWKKTVSCFKDNQSKEINYNSIRNLNPKYKDNPPSEAYFKKLKKELER